jgi:hypothetical protein
MEQKKIINPNISQYIWKVINFMFQSPPARTVYHYQPAGLVGNTGAFTSNTSKFKIPSSSVCIT